MNQSAGSTTRLSLRQLLLRSIQGDAKASLAAAAMMHHFPEAAAEVGGTQYENCLLRVLIEKDAELLVCVAEELIRGANFAQDAKLAARFLEKADQLSPYMGAYVIGRSLERTNERLALKFLKKGQNSGHITSMIARHRILLKKAMVFRPIASLIFFFVDSFFIWKALNNTEHLKDKFWRYQDFFKTPPPMLLEKIGEDRGRPFVEILAAANL
jgi:hypothetical protein